MDNDQYRLLPEQEEFRKVIREFVLDKVAPRAAEIDASGEYPHDLQLEFVKADILSVLFPEEYGGAGADEISQAIVAEEVSRVCASTSMIPILAKLGMLPVMIAGSDEQKAEWFPKMVSGEESSGGSSSPAK